MAFMLFSPTSPGMKSVPSIARRQAYALSLSIFLSCMRGTGCITGPARICAIRRASPLAKAVFLGVESITHGTPSKFPPMCTGQQHTLSLTSSLLNLGCRTARMSSNVLSMTSYPCTCGITGGFSPLRVRTAPLTARLGNVARRLRGPGACETGDALPWP